MAFAAALPAILTAAGSIGGGYLAGRGSQRKESKMERTKRKLVDELLSSLGGQGRFSNLFNMDEAAFQKSYVDPAKAMFKNQIAPGIQQQYIASGQQRGTGLEDQLLRAGVDLDQLLNQAYMQFQEAGKGRASGMINSILGGGSGAPAGTSSGQNLAQAGAGYLSSDAFSEAVKGAFANKTPSGQERAAANQGYQVPPRKGYEPDWTTQGWR